jgi:hypothetical protein
MGLVWDKHQQVLVYRYSLYGDIAFMKQQFVETRRSTAIQETGKKTWRVSNKPRVKRILVLRKYEDKIFFSAAFWQKVYLCPNCPVMRQSQLDRDQYKKYVEFMKLEPFAWFYRILSLTSFARVPKDMDASWHLGFRYDAWCSGRSLALLRVVKSEWSVWHSRVRLSPLYTQDCAELNLYGRYFM